MTFQIEGFLLRWISIVLIFLSLVSPWASNWNGNAHWFLFGYSVPLIGFRFFQGLHAIWVVPLIFMVLGWFCAILDLSTQNQFRGGVFNIASSIFVLFAIHSFFEIYSPEILTPSPLRFNAPPSVGILLSVFSALLSLVIGVNHLLVSSDREANE